MYFKSKHIWLCVVCAAALAAVSCTPAEDDPLHCLTEGYWAEEEAPQAPLMNFSASGHLFYYIYAASDESGLYDACYDPTAQKYTKYAVDIPNGRICFLPDQWYDIKVCSPNSLILGEDESTLKFIKIDPADVRMLPVEEYFSKHPEQLPED